MWRKIVTGILITVFCTAIGKAIVSLFGLDVLAANMIQAALHAEWVEAISWGLAGTFGLLSLAAWENRSRLTHYVSSALSKQFSEQPKISPPAAPEPPLYRATMELGEIACRAAGRPIVAQITSDPELTLYRLLRDASNDGRLDMSNVALRPHYDEHSQTAAINLVKYTKDYAEAAPFTDFALKWKANAQPRYVVARMTSRLESTSKLFPPTVDVSPPTPEQAARISLLGGGDTEVGDAVKRLAYSFPWGKWFAAQHLTNSGTPIDGISLMHAAVLLVTDEAMAGRLGFRGRPPGAIEYEAIPREAWRLLTLGVKPDPRTIWQIMPTPRSEVDPERVRKFLDYDSVIVSSDEFEKRFPPVDQETDAARLAFIEQAKKRSLDANEIARLS